MSREEVERDVTEQIESLARSGDHPAPPEWTLAGGLPLPEPRMALDFEDEGEPVGRARPVTAAPAPAPTPTPAARPRRSATRAASKKRKVAARRGA